MDLKKIFQKNKTPIEIFLAILLTLFLIFPMNLSKFMASQVESPLGIIILFCISVILFFHTNTFLAVYFLLCVYELIRRSSTISSPHFIQYTPTTEKRTSFVNSVNVPQEKTLEEDVISKMAPVDTTGNTFIESGFKPVSEDVHNAFNI